jgi:hypothetical protein
VCAAPNPLGAVEVPGLCQWLSLLPMYAQQIVDIWGNDFKPNVPGPQPLSSVIRFTTMSGLVYYQPDGKIILIGDPDLDGFTVQTQ